MKELTRRKWITTGLATAAGASGLAVAAKLASHYGLVPPDSGGIYGPGETMTYATHRMLTQHSLAREFSRSQISAQPFANEVAPLGDDFAGHQKAAFANWRLKIDGLVSRPGEFSMDEIKSMPRHSHITMIQCEEGWSYIAEWIGAPLSYALEKAGALPQAKYVIYRSFQRDWIDSIDMADAMHSQTLLTYGMNGSELPVAFGGPLRLRVARQIGYKSVKYITRMTVTDKLEPYQSGYAWYAGI